MDLAEGLENFGAAAELQFLHLRKDALQNQMVRRTAADGDPRAVEAQDLVVRALVGMRQAGVAEGRQRVGSDRDVAVFLCDYDGSHIFPVSVLRQRGDGRESLFLLAPDLPHHKSERRMSDNTDAR